MRQPVAEADAATEDQLAVLSHMTLNVKEKEL